MRRSQDCLGRVVADGNVDWNTLVINTRAPAAAEFSIRHADSEISSPPGQRGEG